MKPLHVALLVVVSAVAGGLFMKWEIGRNAKQVAVAAPAATVAQLAASAPAQPAATQSQPAEAAKPAPVIEHKAPKPSPMPSEARKNQREEPVQVAQNEEPPVIQVPVVAYPEPPVQAAPQVAPPVTVPTPAPQPEPVAQQPEPVPPAVQVQPAPPTQVTLKAGTVILARTGQGLSSAHNSAGDGFIATLDQPLVVDGWVIAERGARVEGKVVEAGHGSGESHLAVVLTQLRTSDGQRVPIETETFEKHGQASSADSAAKVAAGAAIGAAIGAIAGGGKGAAIGLGVGTAAGAGGAVATRGKVTVIPAETVIRFRLKNTVTITERQGRS